MKQILLKLIRLARAQKANGTFNGKVYVEITVDDEITSILYEIGSFSVWYYDLGSNVCLYYSLSKWIIDEINKPVDSEISEFKN